MHVSRPARRVVVLVTGELQVCWFAVSSPAQVNATAAATRDSLHHFRDNRFGFYIDSKVKIKTIRENLLLPIF